MIHARVVRALQAVPSGDIRDQKMIDSLNREFRIFGIRLHKCDLRHLDSISEISRMIARKID